MLSTSRGGEKRIYRHHPTYQLAHSVASADTINIQDVSRKTCMYIRACNASSRNFIWQKSTFLQEISHSRVIPLRKISFNIERRDQRVQVNFTIVQWHDASIKRIKSRGSVIIRVSTLLCLCVSIYFYMI